MTRFRIFKARLTRFWAEISAKPVTKKEYRAIGIIAVLGILLMAAIAFVVDQRWQVAAMIAVLAIPGGLCAGVLSVVIDRLPKPAKRREALKKPNLKLLAFNVVSGVSMYLVLSYAIPSKSTVYMVLIAIAVVDYIARRAYRRRSGTS